MTRFVERAWIPLVVVLVFVLSAVGIVKLQSLFGSHQHGAALDSAPVTPSGFSPKRVAYEVFGPAGTVANISYVDVDAQAQRVEQVTLPWSYTITTTQPAVFANVIAQGDSETIGCRVLVNGEVKDEKSVNGVRALTSCLVKSA